ncbi:hypothetical protein [Parenemella sanctibonifatiensis]|uniref:Uncharacterized protein n=1 Tax=Parenemella sanctibonifatiensis TaxID=2016505 RepID=A0A255EKG9_9ACTN|nr:hypothetical protein [Parenemella sanctibonifatiensis]OYN92026.1 hypothetical protein CGZ91_00395 [Parenemella sanctibonifatiensis]
MSNPRAEGGPVTDLEPDTAPDVEQDQPQQAPLQHLTPLTGLNLTNLDPTGAGAGFCDADGVCH